MDNVSESKKRLTVGKVVKNIREAKKEGVKALLDVGFTNQEIAKILNMAESTVRSLQKDGVEEAEEPP